MTTIAKIHTPCKLCVFANYDGNTQTGCKLNRIALFQKYNIEILAVYDDEKEFYVINNLKCLYWRHNAWIHANKELEEQKEFASKELIIPMHAIVFADDNIDNIQVTLGSLEQQIIKPCKVTLVRRPTSKLLPSELARIMRQYDIPWRVENIVNNFTDEEIIDIIIPFVPAILYSVFYTGFTLPNDFFSQLNYKINEEFLTFSMLLPNTTNNGATIVQKLHVAYQGNKDKSLQQKLKDDTCPYLYPISQIVTTFPK